MLTGGRPAPACCLVFVICLALFSFRSVQATSRARMNMIQPKLPIISILEHDTYVQGATGATLPSINTTYYFNQLIDHEDPSKGTFQQRFWISQEFYKNGGPIILFTPGELNAARLPIPCYIIIE
jgi:Serine carboxypeptidase S28